MFYKYLPCSTFRLIKKTVVKFCALELLSNKNLFSYYNAISVFQSSDTKPTISWGKNKKSAKGLKWNFIEFYNPDNYYFCTAFCGCLLDIVNKALCKLMQTKLPSVVISVPQIKDVKVH